MCDTLTSWKSWQIPITRLLGFAFMELPTLATLVAILYVRSSPSLIAEFKPETFGPKARVTVSIQNSAGIFAPSQWLSGKNAEGVVVFLGGLGFDPQPLQSKFSTLCCEEPPLGVTLSPAENLGRFL